MFCPQCSEYLGDGRSHCPNCGHNALNDQESQASKYYCRRCKRYLRSKICSMHGDDPVVVTKPAAAAAPAATATNGQQAFVDEGRALPLPGGFVEEPVTSTPDGAWETPAANNYQQEAPPREDNFHYIEENTPNNDSPFQSVDLGDDDVHAPWEQPKVSPTPQPAAQAPSQPAANKTNKSAKAKKTPQGPGIFSVYWMKLKKLIEKEWTDHLAARQLRDSARKQAAKTQAARKANAAKNPGTATIPTPPTGQKPQVQAAANKKNPRKFSWAFAAVLFLTCGGVATIILNDVYPEYARKALYAKAGAFYEGGEYEEAWSLYRDYVGQHPNSENVGEARQRIEDIQRITEELRQEEIALYSLMEKAAQAFNNGKFIRPESDNAYFYTSAILSSQPTFAPALELEKRIVSRFFTEAEAAFDEERFEDAVAAFQNILKIKPDDSEVLEQLDRTLKVKNVNEMMGTLGQLAQAKEDVKKLQKEKYKLKRQIKLEQRKLGGINKKASTGKKFEYTVPKNVANRQKVFDTRKKTASSSQNGLLTKPDRKREKDIIATTSKAIRPSSTIDDAPINESKDLGEALGIQLLQTNSAGNVDKAATAASKLVEETLIDGGKKEYLHRESPSVSDKNDNAEITMILAECIVGLDGNVETVNIVSPAEDQQLNQLALESFKKYQFKPATFNGEPVKFKSIEVISF